MNAAVPDGFSLFSYIDDLGCAQHMSKSVFLKFVSNIWSRTSMQHVQGHSFHIGGAVELLLTGVAPHVVAAIGGWTSLAFLVFWRHLEDILISQVADAYDEHWGRNLYTFVGYPLRPPQKMALYYVLLTSKVPDGLHWTMSVTAVRTAREEFSGVPVFWLGHSMGGGEVLSFMTQQSYESPCHAETVTSLTGVIITSPLIKQTIPVSKTLRWLGEKVATISPYTLIPAAVSLDDLSHSLEFNDAYSKDPLIKSTGTLRGIGEILTEGKKLLSMGCHHWPKKIPFLLIHGDTDKVTSAKATQTFFKVIDTEDKQIMIYPEGLHELQNEPPVIRQKFVTDIVSFVQGRTSTPVPLRDSTHEHTDSNENIAGVTIASLKSSSSAPNSTVPNTQSSLEIDQDGDVMKVTPKL
ncbi:uncharacterized protein C8R40DRAFT_1178521 [Lentinula edodes]|uniref:uncharacterized protein n=1 Tax=Lentinula edodes TaxID=5353 RepID=UPI001E8D94A3|nr:uncharacterized protein C8R40DRAFT_1178521 [Lentinula edodes]KAH7867858.1 hypothetical protein C8R40DRAFT_1178521 [Lentinula edodes]